jgi:hypothetical protein
VLARLPLSSGRSCAALGQLCIKTRLPIAWRTGTVDLRPLEVFFMGREMRVFLVAIVGVVAMWFGIGGILPKAWQVESQTSVPRVGAAEVMPLLGSFGAWREWSALNTTERANASVTIGGEPGTAGHQITWTNADNEAILRLVKVGPLGIEYDFLNRVGAGVSLRRQGHGSITIHEGKDGCTLVWRDESLTESFTERWFAWFGAQQEAARKFQETSLGSLRNYLETKLRSAPAGSADAKEAVAK